MAQHESSQHVQVPKFGFEVDASLAAWNMPMQEWLTKNNKHWDGLAVGSLVFDPSGRLLIIQRASHDSMPNKWEIPGGAVDDVDPSVHYAAVRELWEESGLVAKRLNYIVTVGRNREPGFVFPNRAGTRFWCRFSFDVEVESCIDVKLDPNEHQDFAWVTEAEIQEQRIGDRDIQLTDIHMQTLLLEGFRLRRENATTATSL
jgi:8-oxo-dGTP pyrophosphatase MutT (NUDIX family)